MPEIRISSFIALIVLVMCGGILFLSPAQAETCFITDPKDTALNVRATPNGKVINRLRNGREVKIERYQDDTKGRPWGYATGEYKGNHRIWGWVFMEAVDCGEKVLTTSPTSVSIVTQKIHPAPGKIHIKSSSDGKAFRKALAKPRKLPRHNSSFISDGQVEFFMPSLDWETGDVSLINYIIGIFVQCEGKLKGCFKILRQGTSHLDDKSIDWFSASPDTPLSRVGNILRKKKVVGASFVDPEVPSNTIKINSDYSVEMISNGERILIGGWYQNDTQQRQALERWKQMHKKMRRYSSRDQKERKDKTIKVLSAIAKIGIAAASGYNGGGSTSTSSDRSSNGALTYCPKDGVAIDQCSPDEYRIRGSN